MPRCPVCGRTFDDLGYQVFLPGNAQPFDRLDCAHAYTGPPIVLVDPNEVDDE